MTFSRAVAAMLALPAALSLAACGGGSTGTSNLTSAQASIRFIAGSPDLGSVDLYFVSTGTGRGSQPTYSNLTYGSITDFSTQTAAAGQALLYAPGTTTTALPVPCQIPQLANNAKYSVVLSGSVAARTVQCTLFQDFDYNGNGQVRVHHASPAAAAAAAFGSSTVAFGFYAPPVPGPTVPVAGQAQFPGFTTPSGTQQPSFFSTGVTSVNSSAPVGVAVGPNATGTFTPLLRINASQFVAPGTTTQPDTAGTLPGGGFNNASVFVIDCTTATTPQGTACASGAGLIGSFDTK